MKVRWLHFALANLDAEARYISQDDRAAATRVVNKVISSVERLRLYPAMGRPGRVPGTRELVVPGTPYVVPYRVRQGTIEVLRVLHGARRWPTDL